MLMPCVLRFRPATRPGLAPAGEVLLLDDKRTQKRLLNVHALHPTAHSFSTVCSPPRTEAKYCSIRARASSPWARSTLRGRNAAHGGANCRRFRGPVGSVIQCARCLAAGDLFMRNARCLAAGGSVMQSAWCRTPGGAVMQSARCIPVTMPVHGWGSICSQFSGGEHTVPNAVACPGVHERLKTFLGPFVVQQKDLACRGETRPRARTET
jgi:hypothetical protein